MSYLAAAATVAATGTLATLHSNKSLDQTMAKSWVYIWIRIFIMVLLLLLHAAIGGSGNKRRKIENLKYTHTVQLERIKVHRPNDCVHIMAVCFSNNNNSVYNTRYRMAHSRKKRPRNIIIWPVFNSFRIHASQFALEWRCWCRHFNFNMAYPLAYWKNGSTMSVMANLQFQVRLRETSDTFRPKPESFLLLLFLIHLKIP